MDALVDALPGSVGDCGSSNGVTLRHSCSGAPSLLHQQGSGHSLDHLGLPSLTPGFSEGASAFVDVRQSALSLVSEPSEESDEVRRGNREVTASDDDLLRTLLGMTFEGVEDVRHTTESISSLLVQTPDALLPPEIADRRFIDAATVRQWFAAMDVDGNGQVTKASYVRLLEENKSFRKSLDGLMRHYWKDANFAENTASAEVERCLLLWDDMDTNRRQVIQFEEFSAFFRLIEARSLCESFGCCDSFTSNISMELRELQQQKQTILTSFSQALSTGEAMHSTGDANPPHEHAEQRQQINKFHAFLRSALYNRFNRATAN
eukprot:TRINITY_DN48470_c0_g1_i1.p1 TRINITY_DN48470_c0_g1~~TRINITY_DN48470_c0_g1_i1.p1  ORF type:complete len:320 (-),score=37.67 TRINITY_DN48470_c0_g1_i1:79-1038(-)